MKRFDELQHAIAHAEKAEYNAVGTQEFEHEFVAVLNLIKASPELRPQIVGEFLKMLRDQSRGSYTLIEFCMHELQWAEMREEAERVYKNCNDDVVRRKAFGKPLQHVMKLQDVISSFGDKWECEDLFDYYDPKQSDEK